MLTHAMQEVIDASAEEVLDFLEKNSRGIQPYRPAPLQEDREQQPDCFQVQRKGNTISIHVKPCDAGERREEIIRVEVISQAKTISLLKALYDEEHPHFRLMFYRLWTRLAIAFGAPFAGAALQKLHELEASGG